MNKLFQSSVGNDEAGFARKSNKLEQRGLPEARYDSRAVCKTMRQDLYAKGTANGHRIKQVKTGRSRCGDTSCFLIES